MMIHVVRGYSWIALLCAMCEANQNRISHAPASVAAAARTAMFLSPRPMPSPTPAISSSANPVWPASSPATGQVWKSSVPDRSEAQPSTYAGSTYTPR